MISAAAGRVAALIPAAGSGTRLGADTPKAFIELNSIALLTRCALVLSLAVDVIVVAVPEGYVERAGELLKEVDADVHIVEGGQDRQSSVARALAVVPQDVDVVLVHDAARPLVPQRVIHSVIDAVRQGADGVVPVLPVVDTVKRVDVQGTVVETVNRDSLRRVQTPQGFVRSVLDAAHADPTILATDDAALLEVSGYRVQTVSGDERALKITTMDDLHMALSYLEEQL
jgi:2-C-methyl-D-erythritol 4-phosphate cytidylyltransferase